MDEEQVGTLTGDPVAEAAGPDVEVRVGLAVLGNLGVVVHVVSEARRSRCGDYLFT